MASPMRSSMTENSSVKPLLVCSLVCSKYLAASSVLGDTCRQEQVQKKEEQEQEMEQEQEPPSHLSSFHPLLPADLLMSPSRWEMFL